MTLARSLALGAATLSLTACAGPLEAFWLGDVACAGVPYDIELELERSAGKEYVGTGEQFREFTAASGRVTNERITFDISVEADKAGGAQDLDTTIVCASERVVETRPEGGDPTIVKDTCTPLRFESWTLGWDGADQLTIDDPDGCEGSLTRRGG